jgi:aryl-alcohol dehydrogenase-like predicted oxidoreductase
MVRRKLGNTGLEVSPIGFGAFKIGRNEKIKYAQNYPLPSDEESGRLLNQVLDLGINLIDTAPAYGLSEERIGRHLSPRRKSFILSTKVGETFDAGHSAYDFSPRGVVTSVERSLKRLKTDAVDLLFLHSDGRDLEIQKQATDSLRQLKEQGKARFIGLSGKTVEGAQAALSWADALMIEYHPEDRAHEAVIEEAGRKGIAILIKKPLASGRLPPQEAIPFILQRPEVGSLIIGGLNLEHIRENLKIATGA